MNTTEIRETLSDYHAFLTLAYALRGPRSREAESFRGGLNQCAEFLRSASNGDLRERGPALKNLFEQLIENHQRVLPRKEGVRSIAHDFRLLQLEQDIWRFGIPYSWLVNRFDVAFLRLPTDLPGHARIGVGIHAGSVTVEEETLLTDAFFLLVQAREAYENLLSASSQSANEDEDHYAYRGAMALNATVCTFSRLGVLTSAAFVETFVNSVGWNEAANTSIPLENREQLRGSKKGRYLSLEKKLECFPRLIRKDKTSPIIISDEKQLREPFRRFLRQTKDVRDSSMHYAPGKTQILRAPPDWLQLVESSVLDAIAVAREFWSACYPSRGQPRYLAELDYDALVRYTLDRKTAKSDRLRSV